MKQFFKYFLAALLALIVAGIIFFASFFAIVGSIASSFSSNADKESVALKDNSILYIDLSESMHEIGESNSLAMFTGGNDKTIGLLSALRSIEKAKTDDKIKGIYLKGGGTANGLATAQQLRKALDDFKTSGKFVYAYADFYSQSDYYLASVADSVFLNPLGMVEIKGLASNLVFFKGALDKLEIQPEIFYCGAFKSATEPFRLDKMSEPNRKQLASLHKDVWSDMLQAFSSHTGTDTATINSWAANGTIQNASDALSYKLVNGLRYKDEIETLLRSKTNTKKEDKVPFVKLNDYAKSVSRGTAENKIAILVAEGEIVDGTSSGSYQIASEDFIKEIRKVKEDKHVKAVVMRVNSPGGSALASEVILRELQLLKKEKPLVVSMGDLAASGGYYISCQADSIFALPNTITGSIGVFGMMFNTQQFFNNKLGVTFDVEKNAPYADFPNLNRSMTAVEKQFIQNSVDTIYAIFKSRVAVGRNMDVSYVDSIGQGRIWTGNAALKNRLIDDLGDINRALKSAASLAKLTDYRIVTYPAAEDKFEKLLKSISQSSGQSEQIIAEKLLERELGKDYRWFRTLRNMQEQKNHVWMMMPFVPEIQ